MRQMWAIALNHFRMTVKSRSALLMMFLLPLVFTLLFGSMSVGAVNGGSERPVPLAVVDLDNSFASRAMIDTLEQEPVFQVRIATEAELKKLITDKLITMGVEIPQGFGAALDGDQTPEVKLRTSPGGNMEVAVAPMVQRHVNRLTLDYRLARRIAGSGAAEAQLTEALAKVRADRADLGVTVAHEKAQRNRDLAREISQLWGQSSLGFIIYFVMMIVFMMGGTILQEREQGTWGRLLTSPTSRLAILGGYLLAFYLTGMFQFGMLVGTMTLVFKVNWGPLLPLLALASSFVLCSAGLGLFLAGMVRSAEQQRTVGSIVVTATSMLGGTWWPLEYVGGTMQRLGYLTPQAWAMDGFREVMLRGGAWGNLTYPLAVLLGFTLVFMTAGLLRVRYE